MEPAYQDIRSRLRAREEELLAQIRRTVQLLITSCQRLYDRPRDATAMDGIERRARQLSRLQERATEVQTLYEGLPTGEG